MARPLTTIAIAALVAVAAYLYNAPPSFYHLDWVPFRPQRDYVATIHTDLGPLLSPKAHIHLPGSAGFNTSTSRWNANIVPTFSVVVEVATEEDVSFAIQWAGLAEMPFLAIAGGHGVVQSLSRFEGGLGIWMRGLKEVEVLEGGRRARMEGGVLSGEVVKTLWAEGKMAVTGACECTGMVAPMLGGGHGWLQGSYGLLADNLVSARVVLADGSAITVSETEHPDLFWALRGAGHNFGIVTSFEYKIYDRTPETEKWSWEQFIFRHDQVRDVYGLANAMLGGSVGEQPIELGHWSYFIRVPEIDPENPVIIFFVMYQSPSGVPEAHTKPFLELGPLVHTTGISTLPGFAAVGMLDMDGAFCQHGTSSVRYPMSTVNYNPSAMDEAMTALMNVGPEFAGSGIIFEAYSLHAVQSVAAESTAFPDRENGLLNAAFIMWNASGLDASENAGVVERARYHGKKIRDAVVRGSGGRLHAYVNYANGDEGLGAMYGYEEWRLQRLRGLKERYDPQGRFGWYAPIE